MTKSLLWFPTLCTALSLAPAAVAQSGTLTLNEKTLSLTTTAPVSTKTTLCAADVTGDGSADAILLDDGTVTIYYGFGITQAAIPTAGRASAIAVLSTAPGLADELIIVTDVDIKLYSDYDAGTFQAATLTVPGWSDAVDVAATDLGADGWMDLVALAADRLSVLVLRDLDTGAPSWSSFALPAAAHDIALGDWVGSTDEEIVVLDATGLSVYSDAGSLLDTVAISGTSGRLAPFRQAGSAKARCAVLYESAGSSYLSVVDAGGAEAAVGLSGTTAYELAVADMDDDGDDDLFVQHRGAPSQLLLNQSNGTPPGTGSTFPLSSSTSYSFPTGDGTAAQILNPIFADFDNDTDPDLALYDGAANALTLSTNQTVDASTRRIPVLPGTSALYDISADKAGVSLSVVVPPGVETIGIDVWYQQGSVASDSEPQALYGGSFTVVPGTRTAIAIEFDTLLNAMDRIYNIDLHPLDTVAAGTLKGTSSLLAVAFEESLSAALVSPPPPSEMIVSDAPDPILAIVDGRELAPSVICIPDIPPFCLPPEPVNPP